MLYWNELAFINAHINNAPVGISGISVVLDSLSVVRGIAIDPQNNKIYWTSTNLVSGPKIMRADMDGQSQEILIDFGPGSNSTPRAICLDVNGAKMYWTNFGEGKIQCADMTLSTVPEDIIIGLNGPSGIAIDADSGKIFWTEMNIGQIKSADLDGSNIMLLIDNLSYPNFLSVNHSMGRMAWTEMGTGKVKSAGLDGTDILDYAVTSMAPTGIVIELPPDTSIVVQGKLQIIPEDTTIQMQNYVQFHAQFVDSNGIAHDTDADWYVKKDHIGPISDDGLVFAYFPGCANIMAKCEVMINCNDTITAMASLSVTDTTVDSSGINLVRVVRNFPNDEEKNYKTIKEGGLYVLGGIKYPYNILNGAALYFPKSSLHEDITIEVKIPEFSKIIDDSIVFANEIVNGIELNVLVNDSLIKPYYFDKPVSVALPFKHGLLEKYGIKISNLGLFFAHDSVTFDSIGISHVKVDSSNNLIYGLVEHFSSLVVRENKIVASIKEDRETVSIPACFQLCQNYPNPFNPITLIEYQLSKESHVDLNIYNILGQKVTTLVSERKTAGIYRVKWDASKYSSGIYFYVISTDNGYMKTRKLVVLK